MHQEHTMTTHRPYLRDGDAAEQAAPAVTVLESPDPAPGAAPTPAPALSNTERAVLHLALELAADHMGSRPNVYGDADRVALATLRKLAGGGA
jgi:hypothetical protein